MLAQEINEIFARIDRTVGELHHDRIKAGKLLIEAQSEVVKGGWQKWCRENIKRSESDIRACMRLARAENPVLALERERKNRREEMARTRSPTPRGVGDLAAPLWGTQVAAIRKAILDNPDKSNREIADITKSKPSRVWQVRKALINKGLVVTPGFTNVNAMKFLNSTDETVHMFKDYMSDLYKTIPAEVIDIMIEPHGEQEDLARHSLVDGLNAITKIIEILLNRFNRKLSAIA